MQNSLNWARKSSMKKVLSIWTSQKLLDGLMPWRAAILREPVAHYLHPNGHYFKPAKNLTPSFTCCVRSCLGATILSRNPGSSQLDEDFGENAINRDWISMFQWDQAVDLLAAIKGFPIHPPLLRPCAEGVQQGAWIYLKGTIRVDLTKGRITTTTSEMLVFKTPWIPWHQSDHWMNFGSFDEVMTHWRFK